MLAADEALAQPWFFAYNLLTGVLAIAGAAVAVSLGRERARPLLRVLRPAAWAACVLLLLRGVVGILALAFQLVRGDLDSPIMLLLIEPWFLVGGVLFGALATKTGGSGEQLA